MTDETNDNASAHLSVAALREWSDHVESAMRGIAHALNNRAAALSAVIELASDPTEDPTVTSSILGSELDRVRDLVAVVRSIGPPRAGTEAFSPRDAAIEALAVLKLCTEQRDRVVDIDAAGAPPTRVPRWMFVRSLIAMGATAANRPGDTKAPVRMTVLEDGEWLVVRLDDGNANAGPLSLYAAGLARAMGGEPLEERGRVGFRVPTLAALRQREAR